MNDPRGEIFAAFRAAKRDVFSDDGHIHALDNLCDAFGIARVGQDPAAPAARAMGDDGTALVKRWESCQLKAYPDPGSRDGKPWTVGWGSTGSDVGPGTVWTQAQADARLTRDLARYAAEVAAVIGDAPTTQHQFDALVSFHYNTGRIAKASLTRQHMAGNFAGAKAEFGKWIYNDGKVLRGLVRRRAEEAELYGRA